MDSFYDRLRKLDPHNKNTVATIIEGSMKGSKLLLENGKVLAFYSGKEAQTGVSSDQPSSGFLSQEQEGRLEELTRSLSVLSGTGLTEIGSQRVFHEQISGIRKLVILGAGHVGQAVVRIGKLLDYHVTVIDDRPLVIGQAKQAGADAAICGSFEQVLSGQNGDENTCFIIVTRGHRHDMECLKAVLNKDYAYLGLMGSRRRTAMIRNVLMEEGYSESDVKQIHMPVGLDIGAETPEEIAISIMGEIIQTFHAKTHHTPFGRAGARSQGYPEELLRELCNPGEPLVLATIIDKQGSGPREPGTKMLVFGDGRTKGTIGGGCGEAQVISAARSLLKQSSARRMSEPEPCDGEDEIGCLFGSSETVGRIVTVDMTADDEDEESMLCGGRTKVWLEVCSG